MPLDGNTGGRDCVWHLLHSTGTELFQLVGFYLEDGLEMAIIHDTREQTAMVTVQVFWDIELWDQLQLYSAQL